MRLESESERLSSDLTEARSLNAEMTSKLDVMMSATTQYEKIITEERARFGAEIQSLKEEKVLQIKFCLIISGFLNTLRLIIPTRVCLKFWPFWPGKKGQMFCGLNSFLWVPDCLGG